MIFPLITVSQSSTVTSTTKIFPVITWIMPTLFLKILVFFINQLINLTFVELLLLIFNSDFESMSFSPLFRSMCLIIVTNVPVMSRFGLLITRISLYNLLIDLSFCFFCYSIQDKVIVFIFVFICLQFDLMEFPTLLEYQTGSTFFNLIKTLDQDHQSLNHRLLSQSRQALIFMVLFY